MHKVTGIHPGKTEAVVTHGTVLSLFLAHYNHLDEYTFWKELGMPACIQVNTQDFTIGEVFSLPEQISLKKEGMQ